MHVVQIADRAVFVKRAKEIGGQVRVTRRPTVTAVQRADAVVMQPALAVDYTYSDDNTGSDRWTFREVLLADERGRVNLGGSLLEMLERDIPEQVRMVHRSGSL